MTNARRKTTVVLVAVLAVMAVRRAGAHDEPIAGVDQREPTIVLHLENHAALPGDVMRGAMARVARVYEVIGVRIVWVDSKEAVGDRRDGGLHLTVVLLSGDMARKKISAERLKGNVVGQAHFFSGRAYIFCDRIAPKSGRPRFFALPLGDVIAHEVGHLLLRENSHSQTGIMRTSVDVDAVHVQSFDTTQANTIRNRLTERAADAIGR
jgi:hypothetical protein